MKIAILKGTLTAAGGLEKYCHKIADRLARKGHEVHILGFGALPLPQALPHPLIHIHSIAPKVPISLLQLVLFDLAVKKWLRSNTCDRVLGFFRNTAPQTDYRAGNGCHKAYLAHRKKTCSFLKRLSFSLNPLHRFICYCEKKTFESYSLQHLIVNSQLVADEIVHYYKDVIWTKIHVIHNGVEWQDTREQFQHLLKNREQLLQAYALRPQSLKILFVGHEWKRKGLPLLLKSLGAHPNADWELLVIGKERHPQEFQTLAKSLKIGEKIKWLGPQKNLSHFYTIADIVVIPSLYDPFANVTVEALSYGCYVVSSNMNGGSEVIVDGVTGRIFDLSARSRAKERSAFDQLALILEELFSYRKSSTSAEVIRNSIAHLDFENQLEQVVTLFTASKA